MIAKKPDAPVKNCTEKTITRVGTNASMHKLEASTFLPKKLYL